MAFLSLGLLNVSTSLAILFFFFLTIVSVLKIQLKVGNIFRNEVYKWLLFHNSGAELILPADFRFNKISESFGFIDPL